MYFDRVILREEHMRKKTNAFTQRETDVLKALVMGYSNKEIAKNLIITIHTVKAHLTSIYRKLGVTNRSNAIIKFNREKTNLRQGLTLP